MCKNRQRNPLVREQQRKANGNSFGTKNEGRNTEPAYIRRLAAIQPGAVS